MTELDQRALLEASLRLNGELKLTALGSSMWPDIQSGDELRLIPVAYADITPGDIVVIYAEAPERPNRTGTLSLVAHRVLKTYREAQLPMVLTKGDNRTYADPPVGYALVLGRVAEARRNDRSVYRRGGSWRLRDRWRASRSRFQEHLWQLVSTRLIGENAVGVETQAMCQVLAFQLDWLKAPLLAPELDWEALYELARDGRFTPVLSHKPIPGAPAWFQERCRRDLRENQAQHLLLYAELRAMLQAFEAANIQVLLVKGPAHADRVYPNPSWRPMVDIDLVVRPDDWAMSLTILQNLGFQPEASDWSGLTETLTGQVALLKPLGPAMAAVELHRDLRMLSERLAVRGEVDAVRAWADAKPFAVAGSQCLTLSPEDALAYASTHWAQHHFFMSIWLLDIALMAAQPDLSWDRLVRRAQADGTSHFVWAALYLVQTLFHAPVPPEVLTALQPPFPKGALISHLVWEKALSTFHEVADARSLLLQVLLLKRWRWSAQSLAAGIFPTRTWLAQHYGTEGEHASTPRLLWKHASNLARLARGRE